MNPVQTDLRRSAPSNYSPDPLVGYTDGWPPQRLI
jgi:hypothetical protein